MVALRSRQGSDFAAARLVQFEELGEMITLSKVVGVVAGNAETLIERPSSDDRILMLYIPSTSVIQFRPGDYVAKTFTADFTGGVAEDILDITSHGLETGDGPYLLTEDNTLPTGLNDSTDYWVIKASGS
jgi:hypothetical protein